MCNAAFFFFLSVFAFCTLWKSISQHKGINASQLIIDHYEGAFLMNHIMTCSPLKLDELRPIELSAEARHFIN